MISFLILHSKCSWEKYFGNIDYPDEYAYSSKQLHFDEAGDYYIYDCVFSKTNSPIVFTGINEKTRLLTESCTFDRCISQRCGGAILFLSFSQVSVFLHKICAVECHLQTNDHKIFGNFAYITMESTPKNFMNMTLTSICHCSNKDLTSFYSFVAVRGKQKVNTFNSTKHNSFSSPGIFLSSATLGIVKLSTLSDNKVSIDGIANFDTGNYSLDTCNFVKNVAPTTSAAALCSKANVYAKRCAFVDNDMKVIVLATVGKQAILTECYLQEGKLIGNVVQKKPQQEKILFSISHYESQLCPTPEENVPQALAQQY